MCDKTVNRCLLVFDSISDQYKTQEMWEGVVSEDAFLIVYCPNKYKAQRMCDEAVDDCLEAKIFFPDCFVTSKMTKKEARDEFGFRNIWSTDSRSLYKEEDSDQTRVYHE